MSDYGEGKTREQETRDSAIMFAYVFAAAVLVVLLVVSAVGCHWAPL